MRPTHFLKFVSRSTALAGFFCFAQISFAAAPTTGEWTVLVEDGKIKIDPTPAISGKVSESKSDTIVLKPGLHDIKFIEWLKGPNRKPSHLLLKAKTCKDCIDDHQLVILSAKKADYEAYTYPGQIRNPRKGRIEYKGRAFYGQCLPGRKGDQLVYFQEDKVDRWKYRQQSVLVSEITRQGLKQKLHTRRRRPKLKTVRRRVKQKKCFELRGWKRTVFRRGTKLNS